MVQGEDVTSDITVAVASGEAHAGLGIHAATRALGLDFIPVARERYDLVVPDAFLEDSRIRLFLEIVRSDDFKEKVMDMGGYEVEQTGRVVCEVPG